GEDRATAGVTLIPSRSTGSAPQVIGWVLIDQALTLAGEAGARTVDLTSRPSREAANRLYERAGFHRRESTVYRVTLD
ncbi:GNAT family N-acetyltransferase, partial [Streptomyces sp. NPDC047108]|uniref:GNAT family N-acetyltransferase n=1 Tax=Streptomyces sp. NPDC047108 TaxID=3155025 RepID=UPI0033C7F94C